MSSPAKEVEKTDQEEQSRWKKPPPPQEPPEIRPPEDQSHRKTPSPQEQSEIQQQRQEDQSHLKNTSPSPQQPKIEQEEQNEQSRRKKASPPSPPRSSQEQPTIQQQHQEQQSCREKTSSSSSPLPQEQPEIQEQSQEDQIHRKKQSPLPATPSSPQKEPKMQKQHQASLLPLPSPQQNQVDQSHQKNLLSLPPPPPTDIQHRASPLPLPSQSLQQQPEIQQLSPSTQEQTEIQRAVSQSHRRKPQSPPLLLLQQQQQQQQQQQYQEPQHFVRDLENQLEEQRLRLVKSLSPLELMDTEDEVEEQKVLESIYIHHKVLDDLVNVNSLFIKAVFVGLSIAQPGQGSLEDRIECRADSTIGKKLIVFEVLSFACFMMSSLVAKTLKVHLKIYRNKDFRDFKLKILRGFMLMMAAWGSIMGYVFLTTSIVEVIQIKVGRLSCGSEYAFQAAGTLIAVVFLALGIYVPFMMHAIMVSMREVDACCSCL